MIGFVLLPIRPAELGKTTNTSFTTSYNAFDKPCAKPSSLELCHGEKGYHEMELCTLFACHNPAELGKTTNTTFTTSYNLHAFACSNPAAR